MSPDSSTSSGGSDPVPTATAPPDGDGDRYRHDAADIPPGRLAVTVQKNLLVLFLVLLSALAIPACDGRKFFGASKNGESLTGPALVELNLSKGVAEKGASTLFGPIPGTSHADLVDTIVSFDEETKAVFVRLGSAHIGFATASEIGRLLKAVRDRGVTITCHADGLDNSTLLLARSPAARSGSARPVASTRSASPSR